MTHSRRQRLKRALKCLISLRLRKRHCERVKERAFWVKPWLVNRQEDGVYWNLVKRLSREDPKGHRSLLRLEHGDFQQILSMIENDITRNNTNMRASISAGERLAITLHYLATGKFIQCLTIHALHMGLFSFLLHVLD